MRGVSSPIISLHSPSSSSTVPPNLLRQRIQRHTISVDRRLRIGALNIRSVNNDTDDVRYIVDSHHLDVIALTETWHEDADYVPIKILRGLGLVEAAREIPVGTKDDNIGYVNHGGVAVASRSGVAIARVVLALKIRTFEHECVRIISKGASTIPTIIYRPGSDPARNVFFQRTVCLPLVHFSDIAD